MQETIMINLPIIIDVKRFGKKEKWTNQRNSLADPPCYQIFFDTPDGKIEIPYEILMCDGIFEEVMETIEEMRDDSILQAKIQRDGFIE